MKKTLIALAALAAGAAFAQSSVTMYGTLDIGYSDTNAAGVKLGQSNGGTSFHTPSRFGIKGTEDLGGGLKANFDLQSGNMDLSNGASSGLNFTRESWVGVSGAFGSTRIGRTTSFGTQSQAGFDLNGISTSSAPALVGVSPVTWYGSSRRDAQLQYESPSFGGVVAGIAFVASGDNSNKSSTQVKVNYSNGPLAAGFVAETARSAAARTAWALGASYDFGVAKVAAGYSNSETAGVTYTAATGVANGGKGVYVGVSAPFGATTVGAQFAKNTTSDDTALELFANYALSKRTIVYVDAGRLNYKAAGSADLTKYGVGVAHSF